MLAPEMKDKPTMASFMAAYSQFESGADTPRAFLERCLATIDRWEPKIGAFVSFNIAGAREAANRATERWREGRPLSPIDGMPVAVKDIIETIDMPTEMGSSLYSGWRSDRDAASVAALREAGAVILGKAVTTEFAATEPAATRNPWDVARTPGGSSSGSAAAVAVGMVPAALGTQVIGSIIRPSSYCGCYGFKPTVGAINRGGSHDGLSQSAHGAIAASLAEAWQVCHEIAKRVGGDPGFPGLYGPPLAPPAAKPARLALLETAGWRVASAEARAALSEIADVIRATGVEVLTRNNSPIVERVEADIAGARESSIAINDWESRWPLNTYRDRDVTRLSRIMVARLANAETMTLDDYRSLLMARETSRALFGSLAADVDGVISLAAPGAAPVGLETTGDPSCTVHTSYLGVPAITLPVLEDSGLPLGLQVTGFAHADAAAFAVAAWLDDVARGRAVR